MPRPENPDHENIQNEAPIDDGVPYIELTEEQEWEVDHLVHTKPATYYDAIYEVTGKRIVRETVEGPDTAEEEPTPPPRRQKPKSKGKRKPHPPLSAREKEIADRRPDLKPRLPRLAPDSEYGVQDDEL